MVVVHNNLDYKGQFVVVVVDKLLFVFEELVVKLPRLVAVRALDMFVVHIVIVVIEFLVDILCFDLEMVFMQ